MLVIFQHSTCYDLHHLIGSNGNRSITINKCGSIYLKFLNFRTLKNFAVIYLKFKQTSQTLKGVCQHGANGIANSEDPDQTAPLQSDLGLHCLPRPICPKT